MKQILLVAALSLVASVQNASAAAVATVNDTTIDSKDLTAEFGQLNDLQKEKINKDVGTRKEIVEGAVNAELLFQAAKKSGAEQDEEYKKAMDRFKKQFLATRFLQKQIDSKLSKGAVKEFFEKNKFSYDTTQIRAYHILLSDNEQVSKILAAAKATKTDKEFAELAKKNSMDPTAAENSGDLGYFTRDRMVPAFAAAAFSMKKGEVRGPVRSQYGYHIIKVVDIKPGKTPNFDEVEARVKEDLRSSLAQETLMKLRSDAKVKIDDSAVQSMKF